MTCPHCGGKLVSRGRAKVRRRDGERVRRYSCRDCKRFAQEGEATGSKLAPDLAVDIVDMLRLGVGCKRVAKVLGVGRNTVIRLRDRHGIPAVDRATTWWTADDSVEAWRRETEVRVRRS